MLKLLLALFVLAGCSLGEFNRTVGNHDFAGKVVEAGTSDPIPSALLVMTIPEGNNWSLPSSYLIGYAWSDQDGRFVIPAHPRRVENIRRTRAQVTIDVFHPSYIQSIAFASRSKKTRPVTVKMKKADTSRPFSFECTYNNPEICAIVSRYLGF